MELPALPAELLLERGRGGRCGGRVQLRAAGEADTDAVASQLERILEVFRAGERVPRQALEYRAADEHPVAGELRRQTEHCTAGGAGAVDQEERCGAERRAWRSVVDEQRLALRPFRAVCEGTHERFEEGGDGHRIGVDDGDGIGRVALCEKPVEGPAKRMPLPAVSRV